MGYNRGMEERDLIERTIKLRLSNAMYEKLKTLADSQFRSMNSTMTLAILEKWERDMEKK